MNEVPRSAPPPAVATARRLRRVGLHLVRAALLAAILCLIRAEHRWYVAQQQGLQEAALEVARLRRFFPAAERLSDWQPSHGGRTVVDAADQTLGYVIQTSPQSDRVIGYSGPNNTLLVLDPQHRIVGIELLSSGDTPEHVDIVLADEGFLKSLVGLKWEEASHSPPVDGVSGATLTSLAIAEGIARRLGGEPPSLRFPDPIGLAEATPFFPQAAQLENADTQGVWQVLNGAGMPLGSLSRTSPAADATIGYQGPTDTLLALDPARRVVGAAIRRSYDNEEYVRYVIDDDYFFATFRGRSLAELAELDLEAVGVEGVSGATMTSQAAAAGIVARAQQLRQPPLAAASEGLRWSQRDIGTLAVTSAGLLLAFTRLRGKRPVRSVFQVILVGYLGFVNGDLLSQSLWVGWAQSGVAWRYAPGLWLLTLAAVLVPLVSRKQVYCHQLCPHGAGQQLLRERLPWTFHPPRWLARSLAIVPGLLLALVLLVAMLHWPLNLAAIEPFDAYLWQIAGWGTIGVAVAGLVASLFVPMAYCRFGCPTGAVLNYLRYSSRSDRWTGRDWLAVALLGLALLLRLG